MSSIHRGQLHKTLKLPDKIPADFEQVWHLVECFDWWEDKLPERPGKSLGFFTVTVKPSQGSGSKHRVFITCPKCGRLIPAGRWGQHRC